MTGMPAKIGQRVNTRLGVAGRPGPVVGEGERLQVIVARDEHGARRVIHDLGRGAAQQHRRDASRGRGCRPPRDPRPSAPASSTMELPGRPWSRKPSTRRPGRAMRRLRPRDGLAEVPGVGLLLGLDVRAGVAHRRPREAQDVGVGTMDRHDADDRIGREGEAGDELRGTVAGDRAVDGEQDAHRGPPIGRIVVPRAVRAGSAERPVRGCPLAPGGQSPARSTRPAVGPPRGDLHVLPGRDHDRRPHGGPSAPISRSSAPPPAFAAGSSDHAQEAEPVRGHRPDDRRPLADATREHERVQPAERRPPSPRSRRAAGGGRRRARAAPPGAPAGAPSMIARMSAVPARPSSPERCSSVSRARPAACPRAPPATGRAPGRRCPSAWPSRAPRAA